MEIYGDRFAGSMDSDRRWQIDARLFPWYREHVQYLGKGVKANDNSARALAYDKTLLAEGKGTNVLYLNSQVVFESPARLEELGIRYATRPDSAEAVQERVEIQAQVIVINHLKHLALAAIMYADGNHGAFADDVEALKPYLRDESVFVWAKQNAEYVGRGAKVGAGNPAFTPLIYWKNPPATMSGTAVAFFDGHVEIVDKARLAGLGACRENCSTC